MAVASTLSSPALAPHLATLLRPYYVPLIIFSLVAVRLLLNRFTRGVSSIPGPPLAKYTRLWKLYDVWKGDSHNTSIRLHRQYGNLVRIGPSHISVGDPKAIPVIYGLNKGFTKVRSMIKATGFTRS
jgi:hypothetical protein